jgi:hypothetical protein
MNNLFNILQKLHLFYILKIIIKEIEIIKEKIVKERDE